MGSLRLSFALSFTSGSAPMANDQLVPAGMRRRARAWRVSMRWGQKPWASIAVSAVVRWLVEAADDLFVRAGYLDMEERPTAG
jgi:hypothetical protein